MKRMWQKLSPSKSFTSDTQIEILSSSICKMFKQKFQTCCMHAWVSYTSFLKQSTSEPIRRKFDEVIFKEDEAWERS
jgi:hypothetical protein